MLNHVSQYVDLHLLKTFDSFLLICIFFFLRAKGIVCVIYLLFRLAIAISSPDLSCRSPGSLPLAFIFVNSIEKSQTDKVGKKI